MRWGVAVAWQQEHGLAHRLTHWTPAALAALAWGAGLRAGLVAPLPVPVPSSYAGWAWPQGATPAEAMLALLGRHLLLGAGGIWLLGLTGVGTPLGLAAVALRAYVGGMLLTSALARWGWAGVGTAAVALAPAQLMATWAAVQASRAAARWSLALSRAVATRAPAWLGEDFARYAYSGAVSIALAAVAAAAEMLGWAAARALGLVATG
ncbi:stage II sporulation protein M [Geochorda subterranea]|uniref:Uncharacterized protein n=1 Tax=Geochorda subterranea TaxID=3109564 RepID=A0ABZ1BL08_9FIRM|nr:hypothetical protein [Limnochorda sp. LNt]WRP13293.1 hypothetical protein VLY81_07455 [Limnochorda sp. LNt]